MRTKLEYMSNAWKHFKTISKHKRIVMINCIKAGQIKRGLLHDNSKFGPTEFFSSVKYYQGNRSPIDAEKEDKGYSIAWQHHKGHNPHHWEYWIDNLGSYSNTPIKIPYEYVVEMVCDWIGAGKVYTENWTQHDTLKYYKKVRGERIIHPTTEKLILALLDALDFGGLEYFYWKAKHSKDDYETGYMNKNYNGSL